MAQVKPSIRCCVDWNDDLFICKDALTTDPLNVIHNGISTTKELVSLHWLGVHQSGINSATTSFVQSVTDYGVRLFRCVTGTNTTAGGYFGRTGSTNDFNVTNLATYTATIWIRATVGAGTGLIISMENSTGSTGFTVSSSWQKITRTFTMAGTTTAFKIVKNSSATNVTFEVAGFMITAGSSLPNGFNTGNSTDLYDNISADVEAATWNIGRRDWQKIMIDEGIANLTLKNTTKRYSPEYVSGPLYLSLVARKLFTIDVRDPASATWTRMFTGWTKDFTPTPGTSGVKTAKMRAEQGKFQLDEIQFTTETDTTLTADQLIKKVVMGGFMSGATPLQAIFNRSKFNACYFVNPADIMTLDTGSDDLNITGQDWGESEGKNGSASRAIEEAMKVERGWFFIDRGGVVKFYNRRHYYDPALTPSTTAINLNTDGSPDKYVFSDPYYNTVQVTHYPAEASDVQILWQSNGALYFYPRRERLVKVKLEYTEGKKKTAKDINPFDGSADASTITVVNGSTATGKVTAEVVSQENGRVLLSVKNGSQQPVRAGIVLKGTATESFGGQIIEVVDAAGISGGKKLLKESSRLLESEVHARNLGNYLLRLNRKNLGEFRSFSMETGRDTTWLARALNNGIGSKISITEDQTGHSGTYAVIGEEHDWKPGSMKATLHLFPLNRIDPTWILGTSVLGVGTTLGY